MQSKTAIFEENIGRWAAYMPKEAEKIRKVTPELVTFCETASGLPNLKTMRDEETFFYHDPENPIEEAKLWVKTLDLSKTDVIFVYGIGLGYYYEGLEDWLSEKQDRYLAFVEDDPEVLVRFMESDRAKKIVSDNQVRIFYVPDFKNSVGKFSDIASNFMGLQFKISAIQLYLRQKAPSLMRLHTILSFLMKMYEVIHEEYRSFSVPFFLNYYLNLFSLPTSFLANPLWGKWKNVPAIICGAGPSLSKNIDTLKTLKDKALIFAGSTSMNALNAAGIMPHMGVGIDPNPAQLMRIVTNHAFQIPYFVNYRMNSYALNAIHGDHVYVNSGATYEIANWVDKQLGIKGKTVMEGYNVINFALSLATILGCNPIIVTGVDLAYSEENSYAPLTPEHPLYQGTDKFMTKNPNEDLLARKDIYGEPVFTLWKWLLESVWYSKFAMEFPALEIINATEGGIGFPGVENIPLKDVAEKYLQKEYDFDGLVHASIQGNCKMPEDVQPKKISSILSHLKGSMAKCHDYCQKISDEYKKMISRIGEGESYPQSLVTEDISKTVLELDQEDAYEHILSVYSRHLMTVMKNEAQKLELDKEWLNADEISQEVAELHSVRFKLLEEAANKNAYLIDNAIQANNRQHEREKAQSSVSQSAYPIRKVEESPDDQYSFENGKFIIKDAFLGIDIDETFEGELFQNAEDSLSDIVEHEGHLLDGKLHGPFCYYNKDKQLLSKTWYHHGKKVGKSERYYDDGSLYSVNRHIDGMQHGPQDYYYRNGTLRSQINYSMGQFDGPLLLFFSNGQLKREINYKNGKRDGIETLWNFSGSKIGEFEYSEDQPIGVSKFWNEEGVLQKEITFDKGKKQGTVKLWNSKGEPLEIPKEQGKDYFDLVTMKMEEFTNNLGEIAKNLESLGPILEKQQPKTGRFLFDELKQDVETINNEISNLLKLNEKMKKEAGFGDTKSKEAIWKTPTMQDVLHTLIEQMVEQLRNQIVNIQNAFIDIINTVIEQHPKDNDEK